MPARSGRTCAATGAARPGSTRHRPHLCPQPERERCRWPRKRVGHHRRPQGRHGHLCCLWRLEDPARRSGRLARLAPGGRGRAGGGGASRPTVFPRQRAQRGYARSVPSHGGKSRLGTRVGVNRYGFSSRLTARKVLGCASSTTAWRVWLRRGGRSGWAMRAFRATHLGAPSPSLAGPLRASRWFKSTSNDPFWCRATSSTSAAGSSWRTGRRAALHLCYEPASDRRVTSRPPLRLRRSPSGCTRSASSASARSPSRSTTSPAVSGTSPM